MLAALPVVTHVVLGLLGAYGSITMCDQPRYRSFRAAGESNLVVRAIGASVPASDALPPFVYAEWQPPGQRPVIAGQVVVIEHVIDDDNDAVRRALAGQTRAVLVPWDHDTGCEPIPWTLDPMWIKPSTVGFVAARLRPRDRWAGGYPTFDVRDAWREPYTEERARLLAGIAVSEQPVMTPGEYGSFYAAFPELEAWQRNAKSAVRPLRDWQRAHPALAAKDPARTLLATMMRAADESARGR